MNIARAMYRLAIDVNSSTSDERTPRWRSLATTQHLWLRPEAAIGCQFVRSPITSHPPFFKLYRIIKSIKVKKT